MHLAGGGYQLLPQHSTACPYIPILEALSVPLLHYLRCGTMELILKTTPESPVTTLRYMPTLSVSLRMNLSPGIILLMS